MSIFDHPDDVPPVATWRCPHCATLQPESTRCWACERTPMTCATCRYFRKSVVGPVGFCGLDRARAILVGDEVRPCWQTPTDVVDLVSDRPGSRRTSWLTLAERQRVGGTPTIAAPGQTQADARRRAEPAGVAATGSAALPVAALPLEAGPARSTRRRPGELGRAVRAITVFDDDDLIEAPVVPPSRKLTSAAQRRSQARRERQRSTDHEGAREALDPPADR